MKTVITHFYNEEYLLPWWLEHHKKIFDFGILIDYDSTDRSVEICREICPNWLILKSVHKEFQAENIDREIEHYEKQFDGWRIVLNVTEFIVGDVNKFTQDTPEVTKYAIPAIGFVDWNPEGTLDKNLLLWEQLKYGVHYKTDPMFRRSRLIHNDKNIVYEIGRHYSHFDTNELLIFHYANCISSPEMVKRRLQIQHRIPRIDITRNFGHQHHNHGRGLDLESLKRYHNSINHIVTDCTLDINSVTKN
jgi:hypothetical protein